MIKANLRVIYIAMIFHLKQIAVDSFVIFTVIVQPLLVATLAIYMLRRNTDFEAIYVIIGSALTGLWSGTLFFSSSNINFERRAGTLELIVASPTHLAMVVLGKTLANTGMSLGSILISYPMAALLFGFHLKIVNPVLFFISTLFAILSFISLSLLVSSFMSVSLGARVWENALEFPMYILSGFMFPITLLPIWVTPLSYVLAPFWVARVLHMTAVHNTISQLEVVRIWGYIFVLALIYCFISAWLFKVLLKKARAESTLGYQ
jgi:ABC-2 type transport system permease protein